MNKKDDTPLAHCCRLIEEKLGKGHPDGWSTQDFEQASIRIERETGVLLSVSTLKRLWGRVTYNSLPATTTLNVLARFIGHPTWFNFQQSLQAEILVTEQKTHLIPTPAPVSTQSKTQFSWRPVALLIIMAAVSTFIYKKTVSKNLAPDDFSFSSQRVGKGIPNSVLFRYNATASPTDSVFIQQSWDASRRQLVPRKGKEHTSIYYYPGYFRAKLVIGNQVVLEHDLYIPSDGWVVAVKHEPVPVYFQKSETVQNGVLQLPIAALQQRNIALQPQPPQVRYRNVPKLAGLRYDNFIFETRIKNDFREGSAVCQKTGIVLLCQNDIFYIPLSAKGCVGELQLTVPGYTIESKGADLTAFGVDMSRWVDVRCEVQNGHVRIWVNGEKAYETKLQNTPTPLVGVSFEFEGTGSVDYARFKRLDSSVVFEDNFDAPISIADSENKGSKHLNQ